MKENVKGLFLDEHLIRTMIGKFGPNDYVAFPRFDLPEDFTVESCHWDFMRLGWVMVIAHPSFDRVEQGCEMPIIRPMFEAFDTFQIVDKETGKAKFTKQHVELFEARDRIAALEKELDEIKSRADDLKLEEKGGQ